MIIALLMLSAAVGGAALTLLMLDTEDARETARKIAAIRSKRS